MEKIELVADMTKHTKTVTIIVLLAVMLIALVTRLAALQLLDPVKTLRVTESGMVADSLAQGKGYIFTLFGTRNANPLQAFMPPLFPAINYAAIRLFADPVRGLGLIHTLLSTLSIPLLFVIAYKLSRNVIVGLLAATAFALYPVLIIMTVYPPSLTFNIFLLLAFLALIVWLADRPAVPLAVAAGFVLGFGLLTRPMFIGLLPISVVWFWLNRPDIRRRMVGLGGIILLVGLLTVLPWSLRNYNVLGRFVLVSTNGGFVFWNGNNPFTTGSGHEVYTDRVADYLGIERDPDLPPVKDPWQPYPLPHAIVNEAATMDESALEDAFYEAGFAFIRNNPEQWLTLAWSKLVGFWFFRSNIGSTYEASWTQYYKLAYVVVLGFAAGGALVARRQWRRYVLLYLIFVYYTLVYVTFHVQTRYRWEIEPLFLILAAVAVCALIERFLLRGRVPTTA